MRIAARGFILDTIVKLHHENYALPLNRRDRGRTLP
jgi:hypothetical protein